jgi:hypothetical protein
MMEANLIRERGREAKKAITTMTCSWMILILALDVLGLKNGLFLLVQDNVLTCYANEVWYYDMSTCEYARMFQVSTFHG